MAAAVADERPPLGRLTVVELRKMTDTRSGFWLLLSTVALTALIAVLACLVFSEGDRNLRDILSVVVQPASIVMPVVGILLVTSEWTQRTAMITFTLVPQRGRVVAAKLLAGVALGTIAFVICLIVAVITTAIAGAGGDGAWSLSAGMLGQVAFTVVFPMLAGVGFGAVFLSSAPAIVLYFVLPTVWAGLGAIPVLRGVAAWLDQTRTMAAILERTLSAAEWAHVGTSLALWLVLPIVVGAWRIARSDVR
jgi:ABC-2 type transport system permease protein